MLLGDVSMQRMVMLAHVEGQYLRFMKEGCKTESEN